jgi:hypothetical protein
MINRKKISFIAIAEIFYFLKTNPLPAVKLVPQWYKDMSAKIDSSFKEHRISNEGANLTIKKCVPFLDAFTSGYMVVTPADIVVSTDSRQFKFMWEVTYDLIEPHSLNQTIGMPIPEGYDTTPFKFLANYAIKTPKGYSTLFTHPLNRFDLPFITLSAVVDTDEFTLGPVNLPFLIRKDFEGVIPAGTPIAQIIPFKRDDWESSVEEPTEEIRFGQNKLRAVALGAYKKLFWQKKRYQ